MERNLKLFKPFFVAKTAGVYVPYLVPFLLALELNEFRVTLVVGAIGLTSAVLEIPTGYWADGIGRRFSLMVGAIFAIAGSVAYAVAPGFWVALVAAVLCGVASSLISGADSALVYETYMALGRERDAQNADANFGGIGGAAEALAALASAFMLYPIVGYRGIMWIQTLLWVMVLVIAILLREPPHVRELKKGSVVTIAKSIVRRNITNRPMFAVLTFGAFASNLSAVLVWWTPLYYTYATGLRIGEGRFGWLYNVIWAGFLGSLFIFSKLNKHFQANRRQSLWLFIAIATTSYLVVVTATGMLAVLAIIGTYFVRSLILPMTGQMVNERTTHHERATSQSVRRTMMWLMSSGVYAVSGWVATASGSIPLGIAVAGTIVIGGAIITLVWVMRLGQLEKPKILA